MTALALLVLTLTFGVWTVSAQEKTLLAAFTVATAVGYILSRTPLHRLGAAMAITALCAPSYYSILYSNEPFGAGALLGKFAWLAAAIMLGGLILQPHQMAMVAAGNLAAMAALPQLRSDIHLYDLGSSLAFVIVLTALMLEVMRQRARIEHERRSEAIERERRLNEMSRLITDKLEISGVLNAAIHIAVELVEADAGILALFSADNEQYIDEVHVCNLPKRLETDFFDLLLRGISANILATRQPVRVDRCDQHPDTIPEMKEHGVAAYMAAPILTGEALLGVFVIFTFRQDHRPQFGLPNERVFEERDLKMLEAVARQTGAAIQNARLFTALRQRDSILEAVAAGARQFLQSANLPGSIQALLAHLGRQTDSSHAYIFENHIGPAGERLSSQTYIWTDVDHAAPLDGPEFQNVPVNGRGLERWLDAMEDGEPLYLVRSQMTDDERGFLCPLGAMSIIEMPIYVRAESEGGATGKLVWWGLIGFDDYRKERRWSEAEVDALKIVAGLLGAAIQRQRTDQAVQERETLYRRAISAAGAVPYHLDYTLERYVFMDEGIQALTGYAAAELTPAFWRSLSQNQVLRGEAAGLSASLADQLARSGQLRVWSCDNRIRRRDGVMRWVADTAVQIVGADGASHGWVGFLQDITERMQAEDEVRQLNAALETRVRERTAELEAANKELEAFAYSVSHDLRAPLRAIDGYSRMLLEDYSERLDEDGQTFLDNVRQSAQNMAQLIEDLLQLSRVTRAELNRSQVDLTKISEAILSEFARQEPGRIINTQVLAGMVARGDAHLLKLVMDNLLSNAWKFTRGTSAARIEAGCKVNAGGPVYFVCDNGAGFDMRYADKLFQPFQRLHSPSDFEGTGVGLATVQRIIRRHGGRIWAEAAVGQGATFYFTLGE